MEKKITFLYFTLISSIFSFHIAAQKDIPPLKNKDAENLLIKASESESLTLSAKPITSYRVVETVHLKSGGTIVTSYEVSKTDMINTYDIGPNNTRIITPVYAAEKKIVNKNRRRTITLTETSNLILKDTLNSTLKDTLKIDNIVLTDIPTEESHDSTDIYVYPLKIYEDVAKNGFKSIEVFKKLGDAYFFKSEFKKAVKWYSELFAMTSDLEPIYYFRYAQSLKSSGQKDLGDKMMEIFNHKNEPIR